MQVLGNALGLLPIYVWGNYSAQLVGWHRLWPMLYFLHQEKTSPNHEIKHMHLYLIIIVILSLSVYLLKFPNIK